MTNHQNNLMERRIMAATRTLSVSLLILIAVAACDTTVSNPGPVQDEVLADRNSAAATVNGAGRAVSNPSAEDWTLDATSIGLRSVRLATGARRRSLARPLGTPCAAWLRVRPASLDWCGWMPR